MLQENAFHLPEILQTAAQRAPAFNRLIHYLWRLGERWGKDQCPIKAAAMAFFGLLSIFPIALAAVVILAQVLTVNQQVLASFQSYVEQFFPGKTGADVSSQLESAVASLSGTDTRAIGIFALLSLVWSGRAYFMVLATVLNDIWPDAQPRSFLQQQIILWTTFIAAGALWLLSSAISFLSSAALAIAHNFQARLLRLDPNLVQSWLEKLPFADIVSRLSSWLLTTLMFWLIYWFLPNVSKGRKKRIVFFFAALAAALWEVARVLFAGFLSDMFNYTGTYGSSVAGVVATMMWIYFSSLILLFGAEAAASYQETVEFLGGAISRTHPKKKIKFVAREKTDE